jgi:hypothetical protein
MSIEITKPLTEEEADRKALYDHAFRGKPLDPEVSKRVQKRAEKVRENMRKRGVKIDAVELIRQSREEI